jgi:hypothetical protein
MLTPALEGQQVRLAQQRSERMRAYDHLRGIAETYLADSGISPAAVAQTLQTYDPEHPTHQAIVAALDEAMAAAAQGHQRGISPSEREALGGNDVMPDYLLGPGDQKVYGVLRDSNLVNAVLGRRVVKDPRDLVAGSVYAKGPDGAPLMEVRNPVKVNEAIQDYETAAANPTKHSSFLDSPYLQHQLTTGGATEGSFARSGDTLAGQAVSSMSAWADGSRRASRRVDGGPEGTTIAALQRWVRNIRPELSKSHDHEWGKTASNRASPLVPDSYSDGTKMGAEDREAYIDMVKDGVLASPVPTVDEHAAAQGKAYSPAGGWLLDLLHEGFDPISIGTAALGGVGTAAKGILKGGSLLGGLVRGTAAAGAGATVSEAAEPMNWGIAAMTFPWGMGASAFRTPPQPSAEDAKKARAAYTARQKAGDKALGGLGEARSLLKRP